MRALTTWLRRLVLSCALMSACTGLASAQEMRLSLPEARAASARMLQAGKPEAALILAEGVLLGAPGDVEGLLLKARALQELGKHRDARKSAKLAWSVSNTDRDRFYAAMVQAGTLVSNGQKGYAQYWLRRAAQVAPEERLRGAAVQDFRKLRRATPWRLHLGLTFAPSDNLNGGAKNESTDINGFTVRPGARPLSGLRYGLNADFSYRVPISRNTRLKFGANIEVTSAELSSDARATDPDAKNNDFREDSFGLSLDYEARGKTGWLASAGVDLTHNTRRGEGFSNVKALRLFYGRMVMPGVTGSARAEWRHETLVHGSGNDLTTQEIGLALGKQFDMGRLRLDAWFSDTNSDLYMVANETTGAQLSFSKTRAVKGMLPRVALSYRDIDYDNAPFAFLSDMTRHDTEWKLSVDVLLPKVDFYGFAPEIGLSFRDRGSNYGIYDSQSTDLRLGIKSVF